MIRRTALALALLATASAALASSAAAAGWLPRAAIDPAPGGGLVDRAGSIAFDDQGNATAIWLRGDTGHTTNALFVARRPRGGAWGGVEQLSSTNKVIEAPAPQLAVGANGQTLIAWVDDIGVAREVRVATAARGDIFTKQVLETDTGNTADRTSVAVNASGQMLAAWRTKPFAVSIVRASEGSGNTFEAPLTAATATGARVDGSGLSAALSDQNDGAIAYSFSNPGSEVGGTGRKAGAAGWTAQGIGTPIVPTIAYPVSVAFDGNRVATMAYGFNGELEADSADMTPAGTGAFDPAGTGSWTQVQISMDASAIGVSIAPNGDAVMTYRDTSASPQDFAKRRTAGIWSPGSGSTAFNLGSGTSTSPVAMARVGGTVFGAYQLYSGFTTSVLVASLPVDSAVPIPAPSYDADLLDPTVAADDTSMTADPAGNLAIAYPDPTGGLALLGYDAVAPVLGSVNVPGSATAGDPVPFSAAADDVWDVSYAWDYGDGSPAGSGAAPTHSYAAPGTYTVQLRVTDGGGGQDTQTRAIAIAPAPSPTPVVSSPTPPPAGPAATVPLPVETKSGNAQPVSGTVKIQKPGSASFVQLIDLTQLPVGTVIDATKGRVTLIIEATKGVYKQADFFEGKFKFTQPKVKAGNAFAELDLAGSSFGKCPATRKVTAAAKRKTNTKSVRHLWGDGSGPFRTVGRFSSATIRGTRWLTDDRCDGTLTRVSKGAVTVRDFVLRKSIALKAPKQYLAKAPLRKTR